MIACAEVSCGHENDFAMSGLSWLILALPFLFILLVVFCVWRARHNENKIIDGPNPEDAYVSIGNVKMRKSTARMAVSGWVVGHDLAHHAPAITHIEVDDTLAHDIYGIGDR